MPTQVDLIQGSPNISTTLGENKIDDGLNELIWLLNGIWGILIYKNKND